MLSSRLAKSLISAVSSLVLVSFGFTASPAQAVGTTHYIAQVASAGDGTSCTSPGYAARINGNIGEDHDDTIASVIAAASSGDTIVICDGTWWFQNFIVIDKSITLKGNGAKKTIIDGDDNTQLFQIKSLDSLTINIQDIKLTGASPRSGQTDSTNGEYVTNGCGGALYIKGNSDVNINHVVFSDNHGGFAGGAICYDQSNVDLNIANSSFLYNSANYDGGDILKAFTFGGNPASITISNSTFAHGTAGRQGSSISDVFDGTQTNVYNSTFINDNPNQPDTIQGVILHQSVLYSASGSPCALATADNTNRSYPACDAAIELTGGNSFGPLGYRGGSVPTYSIGAQEMIDLGPCDVSITSDARGLSRPQGASCDAGAFEYPIGAPSWTLTTPYEMGAAQTVEYGATIEPVSTPAVNSEELEIRYLGVTDNICSVDTASGEVTALASGTCEIQVSVLGDLTHVDTFFTEEIGLTVFTRPQVNSLYFFNTNDYYLTTGEDIRIVAEFDTDVTVVGSPRLKLETGSNDAYATFVEQLNPRGIEFNYTVREGDTVKRLGLNATNPFELNGGTIKSADNTDADVTLDSNQISWLQNNDTIVVNPNDAVGSWGQLGSGIGGDDETFALSVARNGDLLAAGWFNQIGKATNTENVARLSASQNKWMPLNTDPGISSIDDDSYEIVEAPNGDIYVGGNFQGADGNDTMDYIARWDGAQWHSVGSIDDDGALDCGDMSGSCGVFAMAFDADGNLYAGGNIALRGDSAARGVLKWNGTEWSSLAPSDADENVRGLDNAVRDIVVDSQGNVIIGGLFENVGGLEGADHVASWDGTNWIAFGDEAVNSNVLSLAVGKNDVVYVGSQASNYAGIAQADYIGKWDGAAWSALGNDTNDGTPDVGEGAIDDYVLGIAVDTSGESDVVYAGGDFDNAGNIDEADKIAKFENGIWSKLGDEGTFDVDDHVRDIALDQSGNLYIGGWFNDFNGDSGIDGFAKFDGQEWSAVGDSYSSVFNGSDVYSVKTAPNGDIYAGGNFENIGGDPTADYLAKWDGEAWSGVGSYDYGNGQTDGYLICGNGSGSCGVFAIDFDSLGNLYVGGRFASREYNNPLLEKVAKWNGTSWSNVGANFTNDGPAIGNSVRAIAVDEADNVYVGGMFYDAGGVDTADRLAKWNGTAWSGIGNGNNNDSTDGAFVNASVIHDIAFGPSGDLYVTGNFNDAASVSTADNLARWDGQVWAGVGNDGSGDGALNDQALTIAFTEGEGADKFYVGGEFDNVGNTEGDKVGYWSGTGWESVGPNGGDEVFRSMVRKIAISSENELFIGGNFSDADDNPLADKFVRWFGGSFQTYGDRNANQTSNNGAFDNDVFDIDFTSDGAIVTAGSFDNGWEVNGVAIWGNTSSSAPTITDRRFGDLTIGEDYSFDINADGVITVVDGDLPDGLLVNVNTGVISGSPTTLGNYDFTIRVTLNGGEVLHHYAGEVVGEEANGDPLDPISENTTYILGNVVGTLDGDDIRVTKKVNGSQTELRLSGTGFTLNATGIASDGRALGLNGGVLVVERGRTVELEGSGYEPGSTVKVYGFSSPRLLGTITVNSAGKFKKQVRIGTGLSAGNHSLQVNGYSPNGKVRSVSTGIKVIKKSTTKTKLVTVYFGAKSAKLSAKSKAKLAAAIKTIKAKKATRLTVKGYVQPWSPNRGDITLSGARAKAVKAYLKKKGVTTHITTVAKGRAVGLGASGRKAVLSIRYQVPAE